MAVRIVLNQAEMGEIALKYVQQFLVGLALLF